MPNHIFDQLKKGISKKASQLLLLNIYLRAHMQRYHPRIPVDLLFILLVLSSTHHEKANFVALAVFLYA